MNLKQNVKNNQLAWGLGIGTVVIAGFFGGVIWIATEPLEEESTSSLPSTDTQQKKQTSASVPEPSTPDPEEYQRDNLNGTLVSKDTSQRIFIITPRGLPGERPDELKVSVSKQTPIKLRAAQNDQVSFQELTFEDLRSEDDVILKFSTPITSYKESLKPQEVIISAN